MMKLLPILALLLLAVGCAQSLPDRLAQAKAGYTVAVDGLVAIDTAKPFDAKAKKAIGRTFQAIESQIDAADADIAKGDVTEADIFLDQAEAAIATARRLAK